MLRSTFSSLRLGHRAQSFRLSHTNKFFPAPFSSVTKTDGDSNHQLSNDIADVLIAGCGIAGCGAALTLAEKGLKVTILSANKNRNESNSFYAQGGIIYDKGPASVLVEDIIVAGAGRSDPVAAFELAKEGPKAIEELLFQTSKVDFDKDDKGNLALCLEAAHSLPRIIHNKDATGKAIMESMTEAVANHPNIKLISNVTAIDLITNESVCNGAFVYDNDTQDIYALHARDTILATGGLGDIYEHTSNPVGSRGDGVAMAMRAGVQVENMEYVQFHPTSLYIPNENRFLLTEALRGEGAELLTADTQKPFMKKYHDLGALAPRDIVSRGVFSEMQRTQSDHVWLDISHKPKDWIHKRFPSITAKCQSYGLDIASEPVPIVPCAHYACGGIKVDRDGQTSLSGLKAIGEVSCTGLHGGNRLASTSLVEGLVWGRNAAIAIHNNKKRFSQRRYDSHYIEKCSLPVVAKDKINAARSQLKNIMWEGVGIVRNFEGMEKASQQLKDMLSTWDKIYDQSSLTPDLIGLRNAISVGQIINQAAMANKGSVGAHYRSDAEIVLKEKITEKVYRASHGIASSYHNTPFGDMHKIPQFASAAGFGTFAKPTPRRTMSTSAMSINGFPSLTIKASSLIPRGTFAEAQAMFLNPDPDTISNLNTLLKVNNIGVVAHFYMDPELQGVLNGCAWPHIKIADSLLMGDYAVEMANQGIDGIIVLGVDFMSENVNAILRANGHNTPVYRCTEKSIGCSLAESAEGINYGAYLTKASKVPNALHVVYINTSLLTKANAHSLVPTITCTSSNVVQTVLQAYAQIPNCTVFFGPDTYMGENLEQLFTYMASHMTNEEIAAVHPDHNQDSIKDLLSRFNYFGQGICVVHHMFGQKVVDRVRTEHSDAYYTAHFEVPGEMFQLAMKAQQNGEGVVGSTSGILDFIVDKVRNAKTDSKLKFVLGTEAGMITPVVEAVQKVLSAKKDINIEAEIIFPVSSEAVTQDTDFGVVPGVASGEGCSVSGGCATCPYMKMNSLDSLVDVLELIATPDSPRLSGYYPKLYNEKVDGMSTFEVGTIPIQHMREFGNHNCFGNMLIQDVATRSDNLNGQGDVGNKNFA